MDHFGNIYSASTISLDGRQTNNGVAEAVEIIHRPVSVTLSKEEPGTDPSFLENTLKKPLNKNKEEGDFNCNGRDKEVIIVYFSIQVCKEILGQSSLTNIGTIKGKTTVQFGDIKIVSPGGRKKNNLSTMLK